MSNSLRTKLPLLFESQAQKEITYNEMIQALDVLLHTCVIAIRNTPPSAVNTGDSYIVAKVNKIEDREGTGEGDWSEHENKIAVYDGDWKFIAAFDGLTVWVKQEKCHYVFDDGNWLRTRAFEAPTLPESSSTDDFISVPFPINNNKSKK